MKYHYLNKIKKIDENNLPSLSEIVLASLELFEKEGISKLEVPKFKKPLIIGSGNAIATAKVIFNNSDAIFADENNFTEKYKLNPDGALIFSASGEKHAPIIAKFLKSKKIDTFLVTCSKNSSAEKIIGKKNTLITKKIKEPYTYNTSTYLGWILAFTKENPSKIKKEILKIDKKIKDFDFGLYNGYLLGLRNEFELLEKLFNVKFVELFGRQISRDVYTFEELKHAVTVVPSKSELGIEFGGEFFDFEGDRLNIPISKNCRFGEMMAIGYFVIGKIQEKHKPFFKENISRYIKRLNKTSFGKGLKVIVD